MIISSASDFREAARRRLPRFLFDYADGGAYAEATLRRNVDDLSDIALRQRVLRDVATIDLTTTLFGRE
ncbi:MAG TPA: alpha-hydroxy-acid oxidizing protein, partial [Sphingomonas sp.]|nr:alpha-hydroxy-acid oxidizing protein [Sphingomonas sp.]